MVCLAGENSFLSTLVRTSIFYLQGHEVMLDKLVKNGAAYKEKTNKNHYLSWIVENSIIYLRQRIN